jgi:hypothetical protein
LGLTTRPGGKQQPVSATQSGKILPLRSDEGLTGLTENMIRYRGHEELSCNA